jgi:hypothetical protein
MMDYAPLASRALANITSLPLANISADPLPADGGSRRRRLQQEQQTPVQFSLVSADRNKTVRDIYRSIASNGIYDAMRAEGLTVMPSSVEVTGQDSPDARTREVPLTPPPESAAGDKSDGVGKLVGIIVGSVLGFLLLVALAFLLFRCCRNRRRHSEEEARVETPGKLRQKYSNPSGTVSAGSSQAGGAQGLPRPASPTLKNVQSATPRSVSSEEKVEDWISSSSNAKTDVE